MKYDRSRFFFLVLIYYFDLMRWFIISRLEDIYLVTYRKVQRIILVPPDAAKNLIANDDSSCHNDIIAVLSIADINYVDAGLHDTMDDKFVGIYRCSFLFLWQPYLRGSFCDLLIESARIVKCSGLVNCGCQLEAACNNWRAFNKRGNKCNTGRDTADEKKIKEKRNRANYSDLIWRRIIIMYQLYEL